MKKGISYDYIRGLVEGEGCFTFSKISKNRKIPSFAIGMSRRDKELLYLVKEKLKLRNKVYEYPPRIRKDGYKRGGMCMLVVRDFGQLKNIIIPVFYEKLRGNKAKQFEEWLEKIGSDPDVLESFRFLYKLHVNGFYKNNAVFE